jgi:hypothetical protein
MKTRIIIPLLILMSCGDNGSGNLNKADNGDYINDTFVLKDKYIEKSARVLVIQRLDNSDLIAELNVGREAYWRRNVGDTFILARVEKKKFFSIK